MNFINLLVGLQALAIWQFCLEEFRRAKRRDKKSIQVVLPNFTALPIPQFLARTREILFFEKIGGPKLSKSIILHYGTRATLVRESQLWKAIPRVQLMLKKE